MGLRRLNVVAAILLVFLCLVGSRVIGVNAEECNPEVKECPAEGATGSEKAPAKVEKRAKSEGLKGNVLRYSIEHAVGAKGEFVKRGDIDVAVSKKTKKISIKFSQKSYEFSKSEAATFRDLVAKNAFYRIRVPASPAEPDGRWLYASIKACLMAEAGFKEAFRFHLDKTGKLTGIELQPLAAKSSCTDAGTKLPEKITIKSKASAALPRDAHVAKSDLLAGANLKKSNIPAELQQDLSSGGLSTKQDGGKEKDDEEAQPSFLRKYWYIILPMFLLSMAGQQPEGQAKK